MNNIKTWSCPISLIQNLYFYIFLNSMLAHVQLTLGYEIKWLGQINNNILIMLIKILIKSNIIKNTIERVLLNNVLI